MLGAFDFTSINVVHRFAIAVAILSAINDRVRDTVSGICTARVTGFVGIKCAGWSRRWCVDGGWRVDRGWTRCVNGGGFNDARWRFTGSVTQINCA